MLYCLTRENNKITTRLYDKNQRFDRTELLFISQNQIITQQEISSIIIASLEFQKLHISGLTLFTSISIVGYLLSHNGSLKEVLIKPLPYEPSLNHDLLYELSTNSLKLSIFTQDPIYCNLICNFIKNSRMINKAAIRSNIDMPNILEPIQNQLDNSIIEANNKATEDILRMISNTANTQSEILRKASTRDEYYRLTNEFTRTSPISILNYLPDLCKSDVNSIFYQENNQATTNQTLIDARVLNNLGKKIKAYTSKEELPLSVVMSKSR